MATSRRPLLPTQALVTPQVWPPPDTVSPSFTRGSDGTLVSERLSTGTYYYLFDGLGSVVALTDASGNVVNSYRYDPYGNATSTSGTIANPFRYTGSVWDSQTGLYKMGARYYDAGTGRFTQVDPGACGKTVNLYRYASGDPVDLSDPTGMFSLPNPACWLCERLVDGVNAAARFPSAACHGAVMAFCTFAAHHGMGDYAHCSHVLSSYCGRRGEKGGHVLTYRSCDWPCGRGKGPTLPPMLPIVAAEP